MLVAVRQGMRTQRGGQSGCWSSLLLSSSRALNVSPSLLLPPQFLLSSSSGVHLPPLYGFTSLLLSSTPHSLYQSQEVVSSWGPALRTNTHATQPCARNATPRAQRITTHAAHQHPHHTPPHCCRYAFTSFPFFLALPLLL